MLSSPLLGGIPIGNKVLKWPQNTISLLLSFAMWPCNLTLQLLPSRDRLFPLPLNLGNPATCFGQWNVAGTPGCKFQIRASRHLRLLLLLLKFSHQMIKQGLLRNTDPWAPFPRDSDLLGPEVYIFIKHQKQFWLRKSSDNTSETLWDLVMKQPQL